ncbi:carboxymuconolactone decarboxylase family protein [Cupriavidus basilensis]|uniref:carboxymuconolactone decarboxylase family protein n=1 Tax=Cupriavidus basilensis TaxID=68895 RepID=UPI00157A474C|nr:carboxymuconolactone decarboxylase family protein [Cupriavidus basilensis]NUA27703.1 carboxymuconolactone decarboxylase family protein [Cupriavidus basilensis]
MTRLAPPALAGMTPEQRAVHDTIVAGPRGQVRGPLAVWLHRPKLAATAQALGQYCRYDSSLPTRLSELAILVMGQFWGAEFEWWAHKPLALKAGIGAEVVEAIRTGQAPPFAHDDEAVVYAVMRALNQERKIPTPLYRQAVSVLGQDSVIDLVGLAGYYTLISMTINAFEVMPPEGTVLELAAAHGT